MADGEPQTESVTHPQWELLTLKYSTGQKCKVVCYVRKPLVAIGIVVNQMNHPLTNLCSMVLDLNDDDNVVLHIVNTYHHVPDNTHTL